MCVIRALWVTMTLINACRALNLAPYFTADMNQHTLTENTEVGTVIYQLKGEDPEGSRVQFGIQGTDMLTVDADSGEVTVVEVIDRESRQGINDNEIRLTVTIQDEVQEGQGTPNVVRVPISVIVLDENDNEPVFQGLPYKIAVNEDTPVDTTLFRAIEVTDVDLVGEVLEVKCLRLEEFRTLCDYFEIVPRRRETDHDMFRGSVVLKKPLDYKERQIFRMPIAVYDGKFAVNSEILFTVIDVQNTPPVFSGSLTGIVNEDDPIGTRVLQIKAKDGDSGSPRRIIYDLVENPNDYFVIDVNSGEIRVDRELDRESLTASSGVLSLKVRASELVNGIPGTDETTSSTADVTITIRDVNDEAPTFNQQEYDVSIPENVPFGTPLANLNMEVKDTDTGPNALFKLSLIDSTGKFSVEPKNANGHSAVSIKVNSKKLDYENPNERKFLLLVVAEETNTKEGLSSTATVTVQIQDLNDNSPVFEKNSYTALISEDATEGTEVITINAKDRDSGDFGTQGIRYQLSGTGAELFNVDPITGKITVAACVANCLDYEVTKAYFLSYSATDDNGEGKKTVVNLRITVGDANDNPPMFERDSYFATINEGQAEFQPKLILRANDVDDSSSLTFTIKDGNINDLFSLHPKTGEIKVKAKGGLRLDNIPTDRIQLSAEVTDGNSVDYVNVEIAVKDVNDRHPTFEKEMYAASVPEDAPIGSPIENVMATDADFGPNAKIAYRIQKGSYDDFQVDPTSGLVTISNELDFDRREDYKIEIIAYDQGVPSLSGTTTLAVTVMNKNDKAPYFLPSTQRTQITEDTAVGDLVIQLNATDPDISDGVDILYSIVEPITAVDKDGKQVVGTELFKQFFLVNETTGQVFVASPLDRNVAAIISLTVQVTDESADPPQYGIGTLVITLVDINDFEPRFQEPWTVESPYISISVPEEQPNDTIVYKFGASDVDSNIDSFKIIPKNKFFDVDPGTGELIVKDRIDYESLEQKRITFDVVVFDAGVPQKSASAVVIANIENLNDETPKFTQKEYQTSLYENSEPNTPILQVAALDGDEGEFGQVNYQLTGAHRNAFSIGSQDGRISVIDSSILDRERVEFIVLKVVASDLAPTGSRRSSIVPVNITILDVNDNQPNFIQRDYEVTIVDNIPFYPEPSPIAQVAAMDVDEGIHGQLHFSIVEGNEENQFFIDANEGVLYPNASFQGQSGKSYEITVVVNDEGGNGSWTQLDRAKVIIHIENVNTHKPEWFPDPPPDQTIEIPEESSEGDIVILKVNARDRDVGENQRISYFIKDNNFNVNRAGRFSIDEVTGELKALGRFDREVRERYELVLVARDHGTPVAFETLRFVTVVITDINDNSPTFPKGVGGDNMIRFTVPEEEDPGFFVGRVKAEDPDTGKNGLVYYYIVGGNEERWFSIDKTYGNIYTKRRLDRETRDSFEVIIKATNNADLVCEGDTCDIDMETQDLQDSSIMKVQIFVEDKNDNFPQFRSDEFFVGIPFNAKVGDLILNAEAYDPDLGGPGDLSYALRSSDLYRAGSTTSSGSLVPSPFKMEENGRLTLGALIAEFNQDRFVIDIEAKESNSNHRAKARVNLWVYEPEQLIKLVIAKTPEEVNADKMKIIAELRNVTQQVIVIDDIRFHIHEQDGLQRDMTDMFVHAVDEETNSILMPKDVLKSVDSNYEHLSLYYEEAGIHTIQPATDIRAETTSVDSNLIALIALLIIIFFGAIMFVILCCCMKSWIAKSSAKPEKLKDYHTSSMPIYNSASIIDEGTSPITPGPGGGGTDNPLWIDQQYKAYEEQELTMTVFSDQENSVISGTGTSNNGNNGHPDMSSRIGSVSRASHLDTQSNAYATINKLPMVPSSRRSLFNGTLGLHGPDGEPAPDYATLEKSHRSPPGPVVPGIHSTPLHQSSLPRRFSNDFSGSRSNFIINKEGEPELVADLI